MRKIVVGLVCVFLWSSGAWGARPNKLIRVRVPSLSDEKVLAFLSSWPDVAAYDPGSKTLVVFATPRDLALLDSLGLPYHVQVADLQRVEREMRASGYFDYFHDYEGCKEELERAAAEFPDLARVYDIGDGWEKTQGLADRDILAIKISDHVEIEEDEPEVAIISNHHAREIITPEIALFLVRYLLDRYGSDPYVTYLVDHRQIWIIPTMNPDGLDYVHTVDRWWRKNRHRNADGSYGVDLNRNYGFMWGYNDIGSSPDPSSPIYRGTGPFSEPETQAIRDLCIAHRFRIILSFHSYGRLLLYPWGYIAENTPDHWVFASLADSMVAYNGYTPGNAASGTIYLTNGDSDDWFYGEQTVKNKIFGFTPEVGTAFHPDTSEIGQLIRENLGPCLYAIWAAGEEPIVDVDPLPDTENEQVPYVVRARIRPAISLTDTCILDEDSFWLHYAVDEGPYDSVRLVPTGEPFIYAGTIPAIGGLAEYKYYVTALSTDGRRGAAPRCAPDSVFVFRVRPDTLGPVVEHEPPPRHSAFAGDLTVRAMIQDMAGVDSAWLEYRFDPWILYEAPLVPVGEGPQFWGTIRLDAPRVGSIIEYRIRARDASRRKNITTAPDTGWYRVRIVPDYLLDFEEKPGLEIASGRDWQWGVPTSGPLAAHSGSKLWATNLAGPYSNNADARLNTPEIDLTGASAAVFRFWHWYDFEYSNGRLWDGGNVKISVDGGDFTVLATATKGYDNVVDRYNRVLGGEPAYGDPPNVSRQWRQETFDLTPFVGHKVVLQFHVGSDDNTTYDGWYIDDVSWYVANPGAPIITVQEQPRNTPDEHGPYSVAMTVADDGEISRAQLIYDRGSGLDTLDFAVRDSEYVALIPGQPLGTEVRYYIEVQDDDGNVVRDPVAAPDAMYRFLVTDDGPTPWFEPDSLVLTVRTDETVVTDTLWIGNRGLLDLRVHLSAETGAAGRAGEIVNSPGLMAQFVEFCEDLPEPGGEVPLWQKEAMPDWPSRLETSGRRELTAFLEAGFLMLQIPEAADVLITTWPGDAVFFLKSTGDKVSLASLREKTWLASFPTRKAVGSWRAAVPLSVLGSRWRTAYICEVKNSSVGTPVRLVRTADPSWLAVMPDSAIIPHMGKLPVQVSVDAATLAPGMWEGRIRIRQNVGGLEEVVVLVRVQVEPGTGVRERAGVPEMFALEPNFPNPFNASTRIAFALPAAARVVVDIHDVRGAVVRSLLVGKKDPGFHVLTWDGTDEGGRALPSGVYVCRLRATDASGRLIGQASRKMLLLK